MVRTIALAVAACLWAASANADFKCRLDAGQCEIVYAKWREYWRAAQRDAHLLRNWPAGEAFKEEQTRMRLRHIRFREEMSKTTGQELSRLLLCESKERLAAAERRPLTDPSCSD